MASGDGKVKIGMIGVGGIAQEHLRRMASIPEVEIVALCDPSESAVARTRERHGELVAGARVFSDHGRMLAETRPEAVILCSRHSDHFQQIVDCLDAGAHVLTEKPLVNTVADGVAIVRRASQCGKAVGIAYQRHTEPMFRYIRQEIASGRFGAVQHTAALLQQKWRSGTVGSWRQDPAIAGGGFLHDSGSHMVDALLWVTGLTPETVSAQIDNRGAPVDINDALSIQFREGAIGSLALCGDASPWIENITIWCERGSFHIRGGKLAVFDESGEELTPSEADFPAASDPNANFVNAIHGREPIAAPPICGLRAMELTEAAWRSGAMGGAAVSVERVEV